MSIRIKCPECRSQFNASEELKGRTVECGSCEHQFQVEQEVFVEKMVKHYPGEKKGIKLPEKGRGEGVIPKAAEKLPFQPAAYADQPSQNQFDTSPLRPRRVVAIFLGSLILLGYGIYLFVGTEPQGVFQDIPLDKRLLLTVFIAGLGAALLIFAGKRAGKLTTIVGVLAALGLVVLAVLRPVHKTPSGVNKNLKELEVVELEGEIKEPTLEEIQAEVGYDPIARTMAKYVVPGKDERLMVAVIWAVNMEERYKFEVQDYLHKTFELEEEPMFYPRRRGGIFILEGSKIELDELAQKATRFGEVVKQYDDLRMVKVNVKGDGLGSINPQIMKKLTDPTHPNFYSLNYKELQHIDSRRMDGAIERLSAAEPLRYRVEISRKLAELAKKETNPQRFDLISGALQIWTQEGDGTSNLIEQIASELRSEKRAFPKSFVISMATHNSPQLLDTLEELWIQDYLKWGSIIEQVGPAMEGRVIQQLQHSNKEVAHSAIQLLKRIGTREKAVPALRALVSSVDSDSSRLIQEAIDVLTLSQH